MLDGIQTAQPCLRPTLQRTLLAAAPAAAAASQDPELSINWLVQGLRAAGMSGLIEQGEGLTLLAPSDAALRRHLASTGLHRDALLSHQRGLCQLLLEHLLTGPLRELGTAGAGPQPTLGRGLLRLMPGAPHQPQMPRLLDGHGGSASVRARGLRWGCLQVHIIDRVLVAPQHSLLALLSSSPAHSLLAEAVQRSGLEPVLRAQGPFTLLAPENQGFAQLAARLGLRQRSLMNSPALLADVLRHHLLAGRWPSHSLPWGSRAHSLQGESIEFSALGLIGSHGSAQALLPGSDLSASNGVMHRLADALLPVQPS